MVQVRASSLAIVAVVLDEQTVALAAATTCLGNPPPDDAELGLLEEVLPSVRDPLRRALELQSFRHTALVLQRSFLTTPPHVDGGELAAVYQPASTTAEIGGDWYDAIVVPGGAVALSIRDAAGHDLDAATQMTKISSMLRAPAYADGPPVYLHSSRTPDPLLCVAPAMESHHSHHELAEGDTLLLYADGLIEEADTDISDGMRHLAEQVTLPRDPKMPLADLVNTLLPLPHDRADDLSLLAPALPRDPDQPTAESSYKVHRPRNSHTHENERARALRGLALRPGGVWRRGPERPIACSVWGMKPGRPSRQGTGRARVPCPLRSGERVSDTVIEVTDSSFATEVLEAPGPALVDFWAECSSPNAVCGSSCRE